MTQTSISRVRHAFTTGMRPEIRAISNSVMPQYPLSVPEFSRDEMASQLQVSGHALLPRACVFVSSTSRSDLLSQSISIRPPPRIEEPAFLSQLNHPLSMDRTHPDFDCFHI